MIFIVVKWKPKAEYVESFTDEVSEFTAATRNEPGNMFFDWSRSLEDPSEYVLVEGFRDGDAGKEHVHQRALQEVRRRRASATGVDALIISHEIDATGWGEMGEIKVG